MKNLKIYILALVVFSLFSCRDDEVTHDEDIVITVSEDGTVKVTGHITNEEGKSMSNVELSSGNESTKTNKYGYFELSNVKLYNGAASLSIIKDGFLPSYKKLSPNVDETSLFLKASLISIGNNTHSFNASQGGQINGNDAHQIKFEPNSIVDAQGNPFNGDVKFTSYYFNPKRNDIAFVMPGDLSALDVNGEPRQLATYGMIYGDLRSSSGSKLKLKTGMKAEITYELPDELKAIAPDKIPLWHFDESTATWIEEGQASVESGIVKGEVPHFSFWNCDIPFPMVCVEGCALSEDGLPLPRVTIGVTMLDGLETRYCMTDSNGCFFGKIPANEALEIFVWNECGEKASIEIGPFSSNQDLGNINFLTSTFLTEVTGTLFACEGGPAFPGLVQISNNAGSEVIALTDENGNFSVIVPSCFESEIFVLGVDLENQTESELITHTIINPAFEDLGDIELCELPDEYIISSIDGSSIYIEEPEGGAAGDYLILTGEFLEYDIQVNLSLVSGNVVVESVVFVEVDSLKYSCFSACNISGLMVDDIGTLGGIAKGRFNIVLDDVDGGQEEININYKVNIDTERKEVTGRAWHDENHNGIREASEIGMNEILIKQRLSPFTTFTQTNDNGDYKLFGTLEFANLLEVKVPGPLRLSPQDVGTDDTVDSDFSTISKKTTVEPGSGGVITNIDAGMRQNPQSYCDVTHISDVCETGIEDLCYQIELTDNTISIVTIKVTQDGFPLLDTGPQSNPAQVCGMSYGQFKIETFLSNGAVCSKSFNSSGLPPDSTLFYVSYQQCDPLVAEVRAIPNHDGVYDHIFDWTTGSTDASIVMQEGQTESVTSSGVWGCVATHPFTLTKANLAIGGFVWREGSSSENGVFNPSSDLNRIKGAVVSLYDENDILKERQDTGRSGYYQFYTNVPDGNYYIHIDVNNSFYDIVEYKVGADETIDSDFDPITGKTALFSVIGDCVEYQSIDCGVN